MAERGLDLMRTATTTTTTMGTWDQIADKKEACLFLHRRVECGPPALRLRLHATGEKPKWLRMKKYIPAVRACQRKAHLHPEHLPVKYTVCKGFEIRISFCPANSDAREGLSSEGHSHRELQADSWENDCESRSSPVHF